MLAWAIAYVVLLTIAAILVLARREPTIVRGDWVFLLTSVFVLVAALASAFRGERFSLGVLAATVLVLLIGWFAQSRWWVIGAPSATVKATVDECASRLCAPATHNAGESTIGVPGGAMRLRIAPAGGSTVIVFIASAKHRKVELFRTLLAKQYRSVMPTIRVGGAG